MRIETRTDLAEQGLSYCGHCGWGNHPKDGPWTGHDAQLCEDRLLWVFGMWGENDIPILYLDQWKVDA